MTRLAFDVDWLPEPAEDVAFGPERATWARLLVVVDGEVLTRNGGADSRRRTGPVRDFVVGPLSGIVDWIVEAWPFLLWELPTPFPKHRSGFGEDDVLIPSLQEAAKGWPSFGPGLSRKRISEARSRSSEDLPTAATSAGGPSRFLLRPRASRHIVKATSWRSTLELKWETRDDPSST